MSALRDRSGLGAVGAQRADATNGAGSQTRTRRDNNSPADAPRFATDEIVRGRKVSHDDLIDGLSHAAQSLLSQLDIAIDRRNVVIKMIEEWEPGISGKMPAKYSVLRKELELKTLASVLLNLVTICKFIVDHSLGGRATGAVSRR